MFSKQLCSIFANDFITTRSQKSEATWSIAKPQINKQTHQEIQPLCNDDETQVSLTSLDHTQYIRDQILVQLTPVAKFLLISAGLGLDMRSQVHRQDHKKDAKSCSGDVLCLDYVLHLVFGKVLLFTGCAEQRQEFGSGF